MKNAEIREMTTNDLNERLDEVEAMLVKMEINHAISPLENPMKIRWNRREIARIKTELHRRELEDVKQS